MEPTAPQPTPEPADRGHAWRPLGRVLVEHGFLTAAALHDALRVQAEQPDRRLGELLVERGAISGRALALALAEQHGVSVESEELDGDAEALIPTSTRDEPMYEVWDVVYDPAYERRSVLFATTNFLEAADFACDLVDRANPEALEIERRHSGAAETVWTYSQQRAAAVAASRPTASERFGFDPASWGG